MQETFRVADISCDHCKRAIEGALRPLEGVQHAEVSVPDRSVTVQWRQETVTRERLVAAIADAGYTVGGHTETLSVQMKGSER